jgi:hypothetical protein
MGKYWRLAVGVCAAAMLFTRSSASISAVDPVQPLLQQSDLVYQGAFRLPTVPFGGGFGASYGFEYSTTGFAYNPPHNSLFVNNHIYEQKTAEVSIPAPSTDLSELPVATFLQNFADITEGHLTQLGGSNTAQTYMGGLLVYRNRLVGSAYIFYDAVKEARKSHFTSGVNLAQSGDFKGMYQVGALDPGFVAGYMGLIPSEWQASFGGPALTGNCCLPIITRTSFGPSAFVFNPDDLGVVDPVRTTPLLYYTQDHPTLGTWDNQTAVNTSFNMGTTVKGIAFPAGSRTVLFFGRQGVGIPCYGDGGTVSPPGTVHWCYDPIISDKGNHSFPYKYWVWAYDAKDLLTVKNGQKKPWEIKPYAMWPLELPIDTGSGDLQGVAYDPDSQRLYISQFGADSRLPGASPYSIAPVIQVFRVNLFGAGETSDELAPLRVPDRTQRR